jgi:hypothetical protein
MKEFWIDSDVLIWSKNNAYRFFAPHSAQFWYLLARGFQEGVTRLTRRNFKEIMEGRDPKDPLVPWMQTQQERAPKHVGVSPSTEVEDLAKEIGAYVYSNPRFETCWQNEFARGADAWLIAQASVNDGIVVTREGRPIPGSQATKDSQPLQAPRRNAHEHVRHAGPARNGDCGSFEI